MVGFEQSSIKQFIFESPSVNSFHLDLILCHLLPEELVEAGLVQSLFQCLNIFLGFFDLDNVFAANLVEMLDLIGGSKFKRTVGGPRLSMVVEVSSQKYFHFLTGNFITFGVLRYHFLEIILNQCVFLWSSIDLQVFLKHWLDKFFG